MSTIIIKYFQLNMAGLLQFEEINLDLFFVSYLYIF